MLELVARRMAWGGLLGGLYGLWLAVHYLPGGPGRGDWLGAAAWTVGLLAGGGAVLAPAVASVAWWAGRGFRRHMRLVATAGVETLLWTPIFVWLILNEFVYATTQQVLGRGALTLLWYNTAAVLEGAWEMGARYLVATGLLGVILAAACFVISARSLRKVGIGADGTVPPPPPSSGGKRWRIAVAACGVVAVLGAAWQVSATPADSLIQAGRSVPLLKALNVTGTLLGDPLAGPVPDAFGPSIVSDQDYAATLGGPNEPAPNVVLILLESVPARALHCYGYPKTDITPNIDRLVDEGVLFEHCLVSASFSSASVVSLMTSLDMLRGRCFDHFANVTYPFMSLPAALKLAGYELALFSSGNESFDNISTFYPPELFDTYFCHETADITKTDSMRMDDLYAVETFASWIRHRTDDRPFYAGFYLQSPHFNYEVPEPWFSHYGPLPPLYSNGDGILVIPPDVLPLLKNQYDNALRYADHWVGEIRALLEEVGQFDRTLVVLIGDHGEAFMEHGLARHGVHTWEEMIHVPFIVHSGAAIRPYVPHLPGTRVPDTVSGLDLAPTVAGVVGIAPHPSWQGVDVLASDYTDRGRSVFSMTQYTRWQETVTYHGYKYIYDLTDRLDHLFDLYADPGETEDLADARPALRAAMRALLTGRHMHQLSYYAGLSAGPPAHCVGRYEPDPALREQLDALTRR